MNFGLLVTQQSHPQHLPHLSQLPQAQSSDLPRGHSDATSSLQFREPVKWAALWRSFKSLVS